MEKIQLIGNLGGPPEMRFLPSGQAVTNFRMATNRKYTNKDGKKITETKWWNVECWGKLAEIVNEWLQKGSQVYVEGRYKIDTETGGPRIWTDKEGYANSSLEITAKEVEFLGGTREQRARPSGDVPWDDDDEDYEDNDAPFA